MVFYQRRNVIYVLSEAPAKPPQRPRVFVMIPHIVSPEQAQDPEVGAVKINRLKATIDGLLMSFAHCDLTIGVASVPGRYATAHLPEYQKQAIQVYEVGDCDPMYISYSIQDEFARRVDEFDWFLLIEDDIVLRDSFMLEKLQKFTRYYGERAILMPHRFEMRGTTKSYIDLTIDSKLAWDRLSTETIDGVAFTDMTNPHSGLYCLSQKQMKLWIQSGRTWKNQDIFTGPLESAATYCLLESFTVYKPHPCNLNYFEVQHYDLKYAEMFPEPSPYNVSGVPRSLATATR